MASVYEPEVPISITWPLEILAKRELVKVKDSVQLTSVAGPKRKTTGRQEERERDRCVVRECERQRGW